MTHPRSIDTDYHFEDYGVEASIKQIEADQAMSTDKSVYVNSMSTELDKANREVCLRLGIITVEEATNEN